MQIFDECRLLRLKYEQKEIKKYAPCGDRMASNTYLNISGVDLFMSIYQLSLSQMIGNEIYVYQTSLLESQ